MYEIDVQNEHEYPIDAARLIAACACVLNQHESAEDCAVTIVVMDDAAIAELNRKFRQVDAPTDVLSFPAPPLPLVDEADGEYLGDLVIAFPYASAQAAREAHDLGDSLALLVVHGTLHLLGYDHDTPENRAEMWAAQEEALNALGISTKIVPDLEQADH
jgi:probable rRNA maturation factor